MRPDEDSVPKETWQASDASPLCRVSQAPACKKIEVSVEAGAGVGSCSRTRTTCALGARIDVSRQTLFADADAVVKFAPSESEVVNCEKAAPSSRFSILAVRPRALLASRNITAFAADMIPERPAR